MLGRDRGIRDAAARCGHERPRLAVHLARHGQRRSDLVDLHGALELVAEDLWIGGRVPREGLPEWVLSPQRLALEVADLGEVSRQGRHVRARISAAQSGEARAFLRTVSCREHPVRLLEQGYVRRTRQREDRNRPRTSEDVLSHRTSSMRRDTSAGQRETMILQRHLSSRGGIRSHRRALTPRDEGPAPAHYRTRA